MSRRHQLASCAIAALIAAPKPSSADPAGPATEPPSGESTDDSGAKSEETAADLTTILWRRPRPFDLHWRLLGLPETLIELAFAPVGGLVVLTERYRLDRRIVDLLQSDDGRIVLTPKVDISFGDGFGAGAELSLRDQFGGRGRLDAGGEFQLNGDWELDLSYRHEIPAAEGRSVSIEAETVTDDNARFYGIGGDSAEADRRALSDRRSSIFASVDLQPSGVAYFSGVASFGIWSQVLGPGLDGNRIPVGADGDTVVPPPGFDESIGYTELRFESSLDTRDTHGRPTSGVDARLRARMVADISGADLSAISLAAVVDLHRLLLPAARVLVVRAGASASFPLFPGDEIPFDGLSALGRKRFLRGYDKSRFRDKYGLWAAAEYRFPIYEFLATRVGLDAVLFFDAGTAFGESDPALGDIRYSVGTALRGAAESVKFLDLTLGFSPEGYEIGFGLERRL